MAKWESVCVCVCFILRPLLFLIVGGRVQEEQINIGKWESVCVCVCVCVHACMHACMHVCVFMCVFCFMSSIISFGRGLNASFKL